MDKGCNNQAKGKGYNTINKAKDKDKNNDKDTGCNTKGKGRRENQTSWGARVRRTEKRQAKQQAYHDGEMQRLDNEKMRIEAETEKQIQEIIEERREAELHHIDLHIDTLTCNIKR